MKIVNGKLVKEKDESLQDIYFRNKLKDILEEWLELKLEDIPEIMEKIGVRSKNYTIIHDPMSSIWRLGLMVKTKSTMYNIEIIRDGEKESNPEPYFKVLHHGKEKNYKIKRSIEVSNM